MQYLCDHSALLPFYVPPIIKKRLLDSNIILFVGNESLPGLPSTFTVDHVRFIPFVENHIVTLWLTNYYSVELYIGMGLPSSKRNILSLVGMKPGNKGSTAILVNAHTCNDDGVGHIRLPIEGGVS